MDVVRVWKKEGKINGKFRSDMKLNRVEGICKNITGIYFTWNENLIEKCKTRNMLFITKKNAQQAENFDYSNLN